MSHVTCSRTSCQLSLPFCTTYQAITQLAGQLVVPQRSLNHYISFDIDPTDRVPAIVYDHPTLLVRRPHFRCPTRVWDHFSSSPPREKFPTRSSVARPPSLILTSSHILWNAAASCSYSTRPPRLWTIALAFVCSDLLDNLSQRITSQLDAVHFFPMLFFRLNYGVGGMVGTGAFSILSSGIGSVGVPLIFWVFVPVLSFAGFSSLWNWAL